MKFTHQEFDEQPLSFLSDLLYLWRTQNIIQAMEDTELQHLMRLLQERNS